MLSNDDHSGLFTFLVGLIIVVFAGVALSMMVDRRFGFSKRVSSLEHDIRMGETELDQLKDDLQAGSRKLADREPALRKAGSTLESHRNRIAESEQRRQSCGRSLEALRKEIPRLEEEFSRYRRKYREITWASAVGQSLGNVTIRGGREFRQAVISKVTEVGLEIRHEHGIARLQAPDLDQSIQDRFQWSDEERRARLKEERAEHAAIASEPETPEESESSPTPEPSARRSEDRPDATKTSALREKVIAWSTKVSLLNSERSRAVSAASYGNSSSVPGSLETWQAKASRLSAELAKARSELAAAKAALAAVAPDDPLLRPVLQGR
jgi:hypothetical protein